MPSLLENILVGLLIVGAAAYLVRSLRTKKKSGGCGSCGPSKSRK